MLAGAPDNLTFWTTMTPGPGSSANKQRAWDEVYVDMINQTYSLHDCTNDLNHARLLTAFDQQSADWPHALPL